MKTKTITKLGIASLAVAMCSTVSAATLISSALDATQTDAAGTNGTFGLAGAADTAPAVSGVTTTISTTGTLDTLSLRAVSLINGLDVTYDVIFTPYVFSNSHNMGAGADLSSGSTATTRITSGRAMVRTRIDGRASSNQESITIWDNGGGDVDVEFFRVTIGNVTNSGATDFTLDGATNLRFNNLAGIAVYDTFITGTTGTLLGSGGTGTDISLSNPSDSFAIVASSASGNRWMGLAVQFSSNPVAIPEPSSIALLGLGGLLLGLRRRRA